MFESIVYKNAVGPGPLVDVGSLAESLLFYGRVAVVGNTGTVKHLLAQVPPFVLLSLLRDRRLELHYFNEQSGVSSVPMSNGRDLHSLVRFSSPQHTIEIVGPQAFKAAAGASGQARVGASQFSRLLQPFDLSAFDQASVVRALTDSAATTAAVKALIPEVAPSFTAPADLFFKIEPEGGGFFVDTNLDFTALNAAYHKAVPASYGSVTPAYLLALIQGAYQATYIAGALNSEVAVGPTDRVVQAKVVESVVRRHTHSEAEIAQFVDLTLADGRAIREAVNTGAVPFASVVKLLDSADKFRDWLKKQPVDADLVRAYYQEVIKDSWADKLPGRSIRWALFTGIGLGIDAIGAGGAGTALGVGVSAVDAYIVDRLIKGWKPHQFVEGELASLFDPRGTRQSVQRR